MRVVIVNKFYSRRGGDCVYTLNLETMLKEHGHEVAIFSMQSDENYPSVWTRYWPSNVSFSNPSNVLDCIIRPFGTREVKNKFIQLLSDFNPDVVHLGNIHSQISPVIAEIAHQKGIKVVWSIHDYKLLCPRYDFLRNGNTICEDCINNPFSVISNKCIKSSLLASLLGFLELKKWNRTKIAGMVDAFICSSGFVAELMIRGGFPNEKVHTIVHSIETQQCNINKYLGKNERDYYCYVGRLSHEKGLMTLIKAANQLNFRLLIIGDGPLRTSLESVSNKNIEFLGFLEWNELKEIVKKARFCVAPSEWYEVLGLVNIESLCLGVPVLGANIGSIPSLIKEGVNGYTFKSGSVTDLVDKIRLMFDSIFDYENIAFYSKSIYNNEVYYKKLMKIYGAKH